MEVSQKHCSENSMEILEYSTQKCTNHRQGNFKLIYSTKFFMCTLNSFTEVDILYFGCMELKILFDFHKKMKTPSCYCEKNLNTPLSFTLKKVFAPLHSAPALLYSKFFKPPN